jgi:hypothetical protein
LSNDHDHFESKRRRVRPVADACGLFGYLCSWRSIDCGLCSAPDRLITLQGVGPFKLDMSLEEFKNITHASRIWVTHQVEPITDGC